MSVQISEGRLFEVLSNKRRRYVVHALSDSESAIDLGSLAERVAAWEYDLPLEQVDHRERKRVYTALQQSHLPMMDEAGVVQFDKQRGTVEPTPALEEVDVYMDVVRGREIPWSVYYLLLSGVGLALATALWVDVWPFVLLPDPAWATFLAVTFAVSAAAHRYFAGASRVGVGDRPPELRR